MNLRACRFGSAHRQANCFLGAQLSFAPMNYRSELELALHLADLSDRITMDRFRAADLVVETKPDLTPVSEADKAVEQALRGHLGEVAPDHAVLGEEYGEVAGRGADAGVFRWIIDPIDGTKNYVRGIPIWATLLGLEHHGELVVGVVSAPALGARWWGGRGLGAFLDGEPIRASRVASISDAQLSFAWDTADRFAAGGIGPKLLALAHRCWRTRGFGDFWQHMMVAEGSCDISCDPILNFWDLAALIPILEAAGARWSTIDGRNDAQTSDSLVCTNGLLHDQVLAALADQGNQ